VFLCGCGCGCVHVGVGVGVHVCAHVYLENVSSAGLALAPVLGLVVTNRA